MVLAKGYGLANVELDVPAAANTVYEILSVTKQFTAAAILMLVEEGKIAGVAHHGCFPPGGRVSTFMEGKLYPEFCRHSGRQE